MDRVIVVNSDGMGGDDRDLGATLAGLFFTKLRMRDTLPDAIVFYNSAVKLLAKDSPVRDSLEGLYADGVDILGCGTCLKYFKMDDGEIVGRVSNMQEVVGLMLKANSVITL